jgi:hypothetical protein
VQKSLYAELGERKERRGESKKEEGKKKLENFKSLATSGSECLRFTARSPETGEEKMKCAVPPRDSAKKENKGSVSLPRLISGPF